MAFGCLLLIGSSVFCIFLPELKARLAGWFGLAFFGWRFIDIVRALTHPAVCVILDAEGIEDLRSSVGKIPWYDIVSLSIVSHYSTRFLSIELVDWSPCLAQLPAYQRALGKIYPPHHISSMTVSFAGLVPGLEEAWEYLRMHHRDKIHPSMWGK